MWCGVNRQRAERSRALGPVRPTSDATRAANAAQPTARRRRQRRRPTHPRNTHERAATSDATNTTTTSSRCRCHGTAARLRGGRTHEECSAGGALQAGAIEKGPHDPSKLHQHRPHRPSSQTGCTRIKEVLRRPHHIGPRTDAVPRGSATHRRRTAVNGAAITAAAAAVATSSHHRCH